ncbi:MAG: hypothetical protein LBR78_02420, partial [Holosporales bacterium]|nr:hypothetical protein [Holosporales bacterium]
RERIEPLVVDTTGDRDIIGDEVGVGDEVDEIDIDGVVERGVRGSYVEDMQGVVARQSHQLRCYQELIESYERLSRKLLRRMEALEIGVIQLITSGVALYQRPTIMQSIRNVVEWSGFVGIQTDPIVRWIYETTNNGTMWPVTDLETGWRWITHRHGDCTGTRHTVLTLAYRNGADAEIKAITIYHWRSSGVQYVREDGSSSSLGEEVRELPQLPQCTWAEMAIFTAYPSTWNSTPDWSGVKLHTPLGDIPVEPPVADVVASVETGRGRPEIASIMQAASWRALIGTYTAPEPVEEPHYRPT